ncbi:MULTISPECIES: DUF917 domain-containing protein [Thermoprotei]|uniref:DUF917 domain-containing protein n=1 Tax=Thermoprotei TaxID=183924 RepID=UPI003168DE88
MWSIASVDDAEKLVLGATILGTGGGGDPKEGLLLLKSVLEEGKVISIVSLDELPDGGVVVVPYYVGSIAPGLKPKKNIKVPNAINKAFEVMERELGVKVVGVVASELGGANTPVALSIAARLGIPAVDGDLLGRAAPELHQCTVHIFGIPMYPSVIVSETGNVVLVKEYADIDDYEAIARYLSVLSGRYVAVVDTPMKKTEAKKAVISATLSKCFRLGSNVLKARAEKRNPVATIARVLEGWVVFKGIVESYKWRDEAGFLKGEVTIRGINAYRNRVLRSWIMNEHIMVWLDDKPLVMPPDLFILVTDDGTPITNADLKEGMIVNGIAAKAPNIWRTQRGLELFGPRHFGFDYDYVPVEELVKECGVLLQ